MEGLIMPCMILKRKPHVLFSVFLLGRQGQDPFIFPSFGHGGRHRCPPIHLAKLQSLGGDTFRREREREEAPLSDGRTGRERGDLGLKVL